MEIPIHSDPEVLEKLCERFPYLTGHPLKLRGAVGDAVNLGALEVDDVLLYLLAEPEEGLPYRPDFPFLTSEENARLTSYVQMQPVEPWPQPTIGVLWNEGRGEGVTLDVQKVEVILRPVGNAQLWWGGETGVLREAFFEGDIRAKAEHETLMHLLWDLCEAYLQGKGAHFAHTYARDPALDERWYAAFLHDRGYDRDPARVSLPGGRVAVVKALGESKGEEGKDG